MKNAIRNLIRVVAATLILFGALQAALEVMRHRLRDAELGIGALLLGAALLIGGIVLFALSARLADHFTDDDDDDNSGPMQIPPPGM